MLELLNHPVAAMFLAALSWGMLFRLRRRELPRAFFLAALMLAGHGVIAMLICGRAYPWLSAQGGTEAAWQLAALAPAIAVCAARETLEKLDRKTVSVYAGCFLSAMFFGLTRHIPAIRFSLKPEDLLPGRPGVLVALLSGVGIVAALLFLHGGEAHRRRQAGWYAGAATAAILLPALVSLLTRSTHYCHFHHYFWALVLVFFFRYGNWWSRCAQAAALGICVDGFTSWGIEPLWYPLA